MIFCIVENIEGFADEGDGELSLKIADNIFFLKLNFLYSLANNLKIYLGIQLQL